MLRISMLLLCNSLFYMQAMQHYLVTPTATEQQAHAPVPGLVMPETTLASSGPRRAHHSPSSSPEIKALEALAHESAGLRTQQSAISAGAGSHKSKQLAARQESAQAQMSEAEALDRANFADLDQLGTEAHRIRLAKQIQTLRAAQYLTMSEQEKRNLYMRAKSARTLDATPPVTPHLSPKKEPAGCGCVIQ